MAGVAAGLVEPGWRGWRTLTRHNGRVVQVVVFHSAYGLRHAEAGAAARLRAAGHDVITPDLYDGQTASTWMPPWP